MLHTIGVTDSPLLLETSRHVLRIIESMLNQVPTLLIMSLSFFSLLAFIPYGLLADHVLREGMESENHATDLALLERLRDLVNNACKYETDFVPLLTVMQHACEGIKLKGSAG